MYAIRSYYDAIRGGPKVGSDFAYAGAITQAALMKKRTMTPRKI